MMRVMRGEIERVMALTREVGRGSSWQVEGLDRKLMAEQTESDWERD